MKNAKIILLLMAAVLFFAKTSTAQNPVNWSNKQLMEPLELASMITAKKELPQIVCIGPGAPIPHSANVGMVNTGEGLEKLKKQLNGIAKTQKIVVYCGCCPFEKCPNVRPAINALKEMKFTNYYLLNLPNNIKKDWIDKGFPVTKPD